ncbi:MAG: ferrous iron transport protein A [Aureispira sp.]|nr:ferrous iron transport protein A [Aureispira sp.]
MTNEITLAELNQLEKATIISFKNQVVGLKMMEMGVTPNCEIELAHLAPLGGPLAIRLESGSLISLRKATAATIIVKKLAK